MSKTKIIIIFFVICMTVFVPLLIAWARKGGHKVFRPRIGEVVLVGIFCVFVSAGISFGLSGMFGLEDEIEAMKEAQKHPARTPGAGGRGTDSGGGAARPGTSAEDETLPPFLKGRD